MALPKASFYPMIAAELMVAVGNRIAFVVTGEPDLYLIPGIGPGGVVVHFFGCQWLRGHECECLAKIFELGSCDTLIVFFSQAMVNGFYIDLIN